MRKAVVITAIVGILLVSVATFAYGGWNSRQTVNDPVGGRFNNQNYYQMNTPMGRGFNSGGYYQNSMPMSRGFNSRNYNQQELYGRGNRSENEPLYKNREDSHYFAGEDIEFSGTIKEIEVDSCVELLVEVADGTLYEVETGPIGFYEELSFDVDDEISITGKLVTEDGETFVVPAIITIDGKTIELRDDEGFPVWAGGRMMSFDSSNFSSGRFGRRGGFKSYRAPENYCAR